MALAVAFGEVEATDDFRADRRRRCCFCLVALVWVRWLWWCVVPNLRVLFVSGPWSCFPLCRFDAEPLDVFLVRSSLMATSVSPPKTTESGDVRWAMVVVDDVRCVGVLVSVVVVVVKVELRVASM